MKKLKGWLKNLLVPIKPVVNGTYYEWQIFLGAKLKNHDHSNPKTIYENDTVLQRRLAR